MADALSLKEKVMEKQDLYRKLEILGYVVDQGFGGECDAIWKGETLIDQSDPPEEIAEIVAKIQELEA
jgi:hypothetical protein